MPTKWLCNRGVQPLKYSFVRSWRLIMLRLGMSRWPALRVVLKLREDCSCKARLLLPIAGVIFSLWPTIVQPETLLREIAPRQSISSVNSTGKPLGTDRRLGAGKSANFPPEQVDAEPVIIVNNVPTSPGMAQPMADSAHKTPGSQNEVHRQSRLGFPSV